MILALNSGGVVGKIIGLRSGAFKTEAEHGEEAGKSEDEVDSQSGEEVGGEEAEAGGAEDHPLG
jgi:hypothetical protein